MGVGVGLQLFVTSRPFSAFNTDRQLRSVKLPNSVVHSNKGRLSPFLLAMPKYKLSYFPIRGRAEAIRIVFAVAGVEFEDNRVGPKEWFTELKHCEYCKYVVTLIVSTLCVDLNIQGNAQ